MAKRATKAAKTARRVTKTQKRARRVAKKSAKARSTRRAAPAARKREAPRAGLEAATVDVTMTLDFGKGAPTDIQVIKRIDTTDLSGSGASVGAGRHTAGWDVVSPTVRPIGFSVTIVEDATGRKLFERGGQRTGIDGKAAGAGTFTV